MNRTLAMALAAAVIVAALVIVVAADGGPAAPEAVQAMADDYARYLSFSSPQPVSVQRIVRAARPELFVQEISKATYSDSVYYRTAYSLKQLAETGRPGPATIYGVRPVPYPPKELWCVQLSDGGVVLIGQHHDMYNADWVLHGAADMNAMVERVGCQLT